MLHQGGSTHEWVPGCQWDVIGTLDEATSERSSAFLVEEEGTLSSFQGLREGIETRGFFSSLSTDRGPHYWYTEEAGARSIRASCPGASRPAAVGSDAHSRLFAGGAGPVGACLQAPAGETSI
jgi:hypothetical protein